METTERAIAKALCWQGIGLVTMTATGYLVTGSVTQGGTLALVSAAASAGVYVLHERLWARICWGRLADRALPRSQPRCPACSQGGAE